MEEIRSVLHYKIQSFVSQLPRDTELMACFSRVKSDVKEGLGLTYICFALLSDSKEEKHILSEMWVPNTLPGTYVIFL